MGWVVQPLLFFLARCTRSQLIRQIEFLKAENEMLRKRVPKKNIHLKADEIARLLPLALAIGPDIKHILTIVSYDTIRKWKRKAVGFVARGPKGRPKKPDEVRELVIRLARENAWGHTRILGELKKLGIINMSRQTVVNILKQSGFDPNSRRGPGSWDELLKRQAETLWQCDFFSKRVFSRLGLPQLFAMVFINVATRRVWVSPATYNPTEVWVAEQGRAFIECVKAAELKVENVTRDNDQIFKHAFDRTMSESGAQVRRLALCAPNTNAFVERFIQTIQVECLDHFLVFGEKHFDYLVREYVEHYHEERPHQSLGNAPLTGPRPPGNSDGEVHCRTRLGGLLNHYYREAA